MSPSENLLKEFDERWVLGKTEVTRAQSETLLQEFAQIYIETFGSIAGATSGFFSRPPSVDISSDSGFWLSLADILTQRSSRYHRTPAEKPLAASTARPSIFGAAASFKRMTGLKADPEVIEQCLGRASEVGSSSSRVKEIATWKDIQDLIQDGVFGSDAVYRCARERLQCAAVREGLGRGKASTLRAGEEHRRFPPSCTVPSLLATVPSGPSQVVYSFGGAVVPSGMSPLHKLAPICSYPEMTA